MRRHPPRFEVCGGTRDDNLKRPSVAASPLTISDAASVWQRESSTPRSRPEGLQDTRGVYRSRVQRPCPSSPQAAYRSLSHKCESSLATLRLLSKSNPLRWALIWFLRARSLTYSYLFQLVLQSKPLSSPQSVPTPGGVVHLQGLEPWTP